MSMILGKENGGSDETKSPFSGFAALMGGLEAASRIAGILLPKKTTEQQFSERVVVFKKIIEESATSAAGKVLEEYGGGPNEAMRLVAIEGINSITDLVRYLVVGATKIHVKEFASDFAQNASVNVSLCEIESTVKGLLEEILDKDHASKSQVA